MLEANRLVCDRAHEGWDVGKLSNEGGLYWSLFGGFDISDSPNSGGLVRYATLEYEHIGTVSLPLCCGSDTQASTMRYALGRTLTARAGQRALFGWRGAEDTACCGVEVSAKLYLAQMTGSFNDFRGRFRSLHQCAAI